MVRCQAYIYQPLRRSRLRRKVDFKAEFNKFEFRVYYLLV